MKSKLFLWVGIAVVLVLCGVFIFIFFTYSQPLEDDVYNLSLTRAVSEIEVLDTSESLGWTIYTQDGDNVTRLQYDGFGCFDGLAELGQTFYFSRVMQEELDAPTIQLGTANRNFSIFLNGVLIYTDCPEQDNRIGYLTLPMREFDRKEDVTVSLPEDYVGKTLTIAQSTPTYAETPRMSTRVAPARVKLYCSYAFESELIAESFQTAIIGIAGYVLGVIILAIFLRKLSLGQFDWGLLFLALTFFLSMASRLYATSFYLMYFGIPSFLSTSIWYQLPLISSMLIFLASRVKRVRWLPWLLVGVYSLCIIVFILFARQFHATETLFGAILWKTYEAVGCIVVLIFLLASWLLWRRDHAFFRYFAPLVTLLIAAYCIIMLVLPGRAAFIQQIMNSILSFSLRSTANQIVGVMMGVSLLIICAQAIREEIARHTEKLLLLEVSRMSQQRYDNLRLHNEEVMTLRHDMNRHFTLLRQMTTDEKTAQYLDELIGQNNKIRPVIQSGNEMIDIILSSRLSIAIDAGLQTEIVRAKAPETLPLSDADLCSLTMNLIDNAIEAALKSGAKHPWLKLDLHVKNNFFVFTCENSTNASDIPEEKEETVPKHGLGLKIVRQIAERYDALLQAEFTEETYKVSLALPLAHPSR